MAELVQLFVFTTFFFAILIAAVILSKKITLLAEQLNARRDELFRIEEILKQGFAESRRELREIISEFRREMNASFNDSCSTQSRQFEQFTKDVTAGVNNFSDRHAKKQDEFREKTEEQLDSVAEKIQRDAQGNRKELNSSLQLFSANLAESIKDFNERQRIEFSDLRKQHAEVNAQAKEGVADLRGSVEKQLQSIKDDNAQQIAEVRRTVDENLRNALKKQDEFKEKTGEKLDSVVEGIQHDARENRKELSESLQSFGTNLTENIRNFNERLRIEFSDLRKQQSEMNMQAKTSIVELRDAVEKQLRTIREDNAQQLLEMRRTVDEKLQTTLEKRLGESFKQVSDRLEQVHKGLGEMQTLAVGVGDLKKVLANVKTRGILGEYQLGNILEQMLSPEQYATNVATKTASQAHVEFAVKLPGKADEKTVWLPIDSKFPLESYQVLLQAYEEADQAKIELAQKTLLKAVESFAKDISAKYIDPPNTTDFAIMFLPVESLFAEVLRHPQLFELLQRQYRITVTGPTTLSALLSSLNMGFRTLAVQKRSSEVWKVLAEVKKEFGNYSEQLALVHKQLSTASSSLEKLQETRTRAMERKLRDVTVLPHEDEAVEQTA